MIEKDLVNKIEPSEEDVAVENPHHDWERSCTNTKPSKVELKYKSCNI